MTPQERTCPDCEHGMPDLDRRRFLKVAGTAAVAASVLPNWAVAADSPAAARAPETLVKQIFDSLTEQQRQDVTFAWDYEHPRMGLLRTRISNNWHITQPAIGSNYYTKDQQEMIRALYEGMFQKDWIAKIDRQLQDDAGGYGKQQNIAVFGKPGEDKFELVMTGRHLTMRVDGNSVDHMAFGGPIFHGHAASGFNEKVGHPGNVWWEQAVEANKVFEMLDGKQRKQALVAQLPAEEAVGFRGADGMFPGIPVSELTADQKEQMQKTLRLLIAPYRNADQEEVMNCLKAQGGLDKCSLAFYAAGDLGDDGQWDNWRLEGPSFVWYFRGTPHVHLWINVGSDATVKLNA
jgi:hypothetical protein